MPCSCNCGCDCDKVRYKIVRFYHPSQDRRSRTIKTGLTLAEAQAWCKNPKTRKAGVYFDGYTIIS